MVDDIPGVVRNIQIIRDIQAVRHVRAKINVVTATADDGQDKLDHEDRAAQ